MNGPTANALVGRTLGDKFLVRAEIGRGGMGAVYEAEHLITRRVGALKLLHGPRASVQAVVTRFLREASAAGHIENPHIVEAYDAGQLPSGEPYLFMELLRGRPLSAWIGARGRLPFGEAQELLAQAAEALAAAHLAGIVHRDVKPDNLFLCDGPSPFVKVLDFGISKFAPELAAGGALTVDGAPMGSPYYMSAEQVVGKRDIDLRTDVYSLGVVLYECLTGAPPFTAQTLTELGVKIFEGRYTRAGELGLELPPGLDEFLARAMAVDPNQRFANMSEFRTSLLALAEPRTTAAQSAPVMRPALTGPPAAPRLGSRRRWLRFALAAGIAGGLLALTLAFVSRMAPPEPESSLAPPRALSAAAPAIAHSSAPSRALETRVEGARSEPEPAAPSTAAPASTSSASSLPPKVTGAAARPVAAPSSRARRDGLVDSNPF